MKQNDVAELEVDCENALRKVVQQRMPEVSSHTLHMMAKAAIAVLEAVAEEQQQ